MSSYKATIRSKKDLFDLLTSYEKKLNKKVQAMTSHVVNMSHVQQKQSDQIAYSFDQSSNPKPRSSSLVQSALMRFHDQSFTKAKIASTIQDKLWQGNVHLPSIKNNIKPARTIGRNKYVKPKFIPRKPIILSREVRNNPFLEPRPIPVSDLKKGLINLMNKGVVNRDVDISVAFEWGDAPFQSKGAIIHKHDEVIIHQQENQHGPSTIKQELCSVPSSQCPSPQLRQGWALTGIDNPAITATKIQDKPTRQQMFGSLQTLHIQFKNYSPKCDNKQFQEFKGRNLPIWGNIIEFLNSIKNYLAKFSISLAFVDARRVAYLSLHITRLSDDDISECLVGSPSQKRKNRSLKNIPNRHMRQNLAAIMITKLMKANVFRKRYCRSQHIKMCKKKILTWIQNTVQKRRTRNKIKAQKLSRQTRVDQIQRSFQRDYNQIVVGLHYQIHLPNTSNHYQFVQMLNIEITRIFHLSKLLSIIYVCPFEISSETISYYYKILELGEVDMFEQKVKFISCQSSPHFNQLSLSKRLYYSSKTLKKIKAIIKDTRAFIIGGLPEETDWCLADALKVPLSNNFNQYDLLKRSSTLTYLKKIDCDCVDFYRIIPGPTGDFYLNEVSRKISDFATDNKFKVLMIRIDGKPDSMATVKSPIRNYEDLLDRTSICDSSIYPNSQTYFKTLLKFGGTIQQYTQVRYLRTAVFISPSKQANILGTFQRVLGSKSNILSLCFPQEIVQHSTVVEVLNPLIQQLTNTSHRYGYLEVDLIVDRDTLLIEDVCWSLTDVGSSLFYFKYLANAKLQPSGKYSSQVHDTEAGVIEVESRSYSYVPFALHLGLNQLQIKDFFQLCRVQKISFDLQRKYGCAFTLFQGVRNALGIITTSKTLKSSVALMIQALNFVHRQTTKTPAAPDRESRMKSNHSIVSIKNRLEQCYTKGGFD